MTVKTLFITEYRWRLLNPIFRKSLILALGAKDAIVGRYVANIQSSLLAVGENQLAIRLEDEITKGG